LAANSFDDNRFDRFVPAAGRLSQRLCAAPRIQVPGSKKSDSSNGMGVAAIVAPDAPWDAREWLYTIAPTSLRMSTWTHRNAIGAILADYA
jgi:hypothetical protein